MRDYSDRSIDKQGYVWIRPAPGMKKVREHRYVMEQLLDRKLLRTEHVHHKDEDKTNNDPANLEVLLKGHHHKLHNPGGYANGECDGCGTADRPHYAKGLCHACYLRQWKRSKL